MPRNLSARLFLAALLALCASAPSVRSATLTGLSDVEVGGTLYDVTFYSSPTGFSFLDLWGDGQSETWSGSLGRAPTFWGDPEGAEAMTTAIINALGTTNGWSTTSDAFAVPYEFAINFVPTAHSVWDGDPSFTGEYIQEVFVSQSLPYGLDSDRFTWVSVQEANTASPVPEPSTLLLLGTGLACLLGYGPCRRRLC